MVVQKLCRPLVNQWCRTYTTYTPRRAVLYVPGNDLRKIKKASSLGADCVVLDCEDGVAVSKKVDARNTIKEVLDNADLTWQGSEVTVRVNSVDSGLCEEDLSVTLAATNLPPTLLLPKVDTPDQLNWFSERLHQSLSGRSLSRQLNLIFYTESARSLLDLPSICSRAQQLSKKADFRPVGIVFGSDDFCADIGATRTPEATELLYARQKIVTVCKAFGLQAIDLVHINYKDLEGCKRQSEEGARMGFTGKQVIHPSQVPIVHQSFLPSLEKQKWAEELVKSFKEHQEGGKGAFTFRGHMIDRPLLLQAENILSFAGSVRNRTSKTVQDALSLAKSVKK